MSLKAEQKQRSHATILGSAVSLIRAKGIVGTSVADVMKGAGLTVGGFYAHFGSKQALIDAALRHTSRSLREQLFARLDDKPEADRGAVILKRYLSAAHRDTPAHGCVLPAVVGEVATGAPEHARVLADELDQLTATFAAHLPAARGISKAQLALGLFALMYGGLTLARALRGTPLSDELIKACRALGVSLLGEVPESPASATRGDVTRR
jgi:TetR/AcrR family transcriptional repressor of nem operon